MSVFYKGVHNVYKERRMVLADEQTENAKTFHSNVAEHNKLLEDWVSVIKDELLRRKD